MKSSFEIYHPFNNLIFFLYMIVVSAVVKDMAILVISFASAFIYSMALKGAGQLRVNLLFVTPLVVLSTLINPLINHRGSTVLFDTFLGPFTLESLLYGLMTGLMIGSIIMWFSCFNLIMTSEKITYLLGRILPGISLVFVMVLRFIPRYKTRIDKIYESRQALFGDSHYILDTQKTSEKVSKKSKLRNAAMVLSATVTWALENGIDTADSMRARGYGLKGRTSFQDYIFRLRDILFLIISTTLCVLTFFYGGIEFFIGYISFAILSLMPMIIGINDSLRWKRLQEKAGV